MEKRNSVGTLKTSNTTSPQLRSFNPVPRSCRFTPPAQINQPFELQLAVRPSPVGQDNVARTEAVELAQHAANAFVKVLLRCRPAGARRDILQSAAQSVVRQNRNTGK